MVNSMARRAPFMITGNETVLDVISKVSEIQHLPQLSKNSIWIARPAPEGFGGEQILYVDWEAIARGGITDTNYQILPGDRVYIVDDKIVEMNKFVTKVANPVERLLGISSLGSDVAKGSAVLGRDYNRIRLR